MFQAPVAFTSLFSNSAMSFLLLTFKIFSKTQISRSIPNQSSSTLREGQLSTFSRLAGDCRREVVAKRVEGDGAILCIT